MSRLALAKGGRAETLAGLATVALGLWFVLTSYGVVLGLGVVLIGAVHDFSSLTASVRHGACSIAPAVMPSAEARSPVTAS